ncbi:hypothetical protein HBI56_057760 [Parastagonospora nodorum]|nr:hypothetical protein HBH56_094380 [Parastagonospora nodorum]KAH3930518.1 hypothetical protein HBH54_108700 [Parastagonospora nodorum]KAH3945101.1 hypothetical protein HBH53_150740 [Parastagonospora nodorum]KAH3966894.1 hypothetical protein HBH51_142160 [Parastagonospora nodorum]KAH3981031.1 hypothetical protein HBH52_082080 [Parastagonospora nodorum]
MSTPTRQPSSASLKNLVPSGSFLQQLLEEINGSGTANKLHEQPSAQATPRSNASSNGSARAPLDPHIPAMATSAAIGARTSAMVHGDPQLSSAIHSLYLSGPTTSDTYFPLSNGINRIESPLIFCDIDSDISATPSPTEPPTSALSAALTDATSISEGRQRASNASGSRSPEKRARSPDTSSHLLAKKMRTMTLPAFQTSHTSYPLGRSTWRNSIGSDNRSLLRGATFSERNPALLDQASSFKDFVSPELSSFRPEVVGPQGVGPLARTSIQSSTRRSSLIERDSSPEYDGTPSYAQSLHLVDTDVSIYKKVHGDEWRENSLCLHCFRRHGNFRKLTLYGYEMCGRNEALESHYWESGGDDGYD